MKIRKNLEAVFLAAAAVGLFASYATAKVPTIEVSGNAAYVAVDSNVHTVVVKAPRLTAAEKAALN